MSETEQEIVIEEENTVPEEATETAAGEIPEEAADEEAEETEEEDGKKKNVWNVLLTLVIIIIAALIGVFFYLSWHQEREMDLSHAYTPESTGLNAAAHAGSFTSDLVISDGSVVLKGVGLHATTEKGLLFDIDSNRAVFAQGIYDKTYPASLTKIMTAILAMKYGNMTDTVVMTEEDFALEEGAQVSGMKPGDSVTMEQLFKTLLIYSANDAAMAIARHIDGSVENFAARMNAEAQSLGMLGTHFTNPHGLHEADHYTCAYDVYLMLKEAIRYPEFTDAIRMNVYTLTVTRSEGSQIAYRLDSTDKYLTGEKALPNDVTLWGGKTGTTPEAGSCLALIAQNRNSVPYIAVILNADNSAVLYEDMSLLLSHINDGT